MVSPDEIPGNIKEIVLICLKINFTGLLNVLGFSKKVLLSGVLLLVTMVKWLILKAQIVCLLHGQRKCGPLG